MAGLSTSTGFLAYDVESYRDSQSYKGTRGENAVVSTAVDATAYEVLKYRKSDGTWYIARTFYHAVGGGATEASQNVFTGEHWQARLQDAVPQGRARRRRGRRAL